MTEEQTDYIKTVILRAKVDDIGCGYSRLKPWRQLCDYRGIDKERIADSGTIEFDLSQPCPHLRHDIAFVSWPIDRKSIAWHLFLRKYKEIIYLGCNTDGIVCGDPDFWAIVGKREILKIIPDRQETLIHYGVGERKPKTPEPLEEMASRLTWEECKITRYTQPK
jgi:hypothetical protein